MWMKKNQHVDNRSLHDEVLYLGVYYLDVGTLNVTISKPSDLCNL